MCWIYPNSTQEAGHSSSPHSMTWHFFRLRGSRIEPSPWTSSSDTWFGQTRKRRRTPCVLLPVRGEAMRWTHPTKMRPHSHWWHGVFVAWWPDAQDSATLSGREGIPEVGSGSWARTAVPDKFSEDLIVSPDAKEAGHMSRDVTDESIHLAMLCHIFHSAGHSWRVNMLRIYHRGTTRGWVGHYQRQNGCSMHVRSSG